MSLTWKDGLASAFVGAAVALYMLSLGDTTIVGLSGPRALTIAVFALGVGGCYTAKSQMQDVYGVGGGPRPPLLYVVLASALGGVCHARGRNCRDVRWKCLGAGDVDGGHGSGVGAGHDPPLDVTQDSRGYPPGALMSQVVLIRAVRHRIHR